MIHYTHPEKQNETRKTTPVTVVLLVAAAANIKMKMTKMMMMKMTMQTARITTLIIITAI